MSTSAEPSAFDGGLERARKTYAEAQAILAMNPSWKPAQERVACAERALSALSGSVFEVVDSSNEETYWTLGIWPTLQEALAALDVENPKDVGCADADEYDEHRTIEVRERKIGWGGSGQRVAKVEWKGMWDEPSDEYKWSRVQTLNRRHHDGRP